MKVLTTEQQTELKELVETCLNEGQFMGGTRASLIYWSNELKPKRRRRVGVEPLKRKGRPKKAAVEEIAVDNGPII